MNVEFQNKVKNEIIHFNIIYNLKLYSLRDDKMCSEIQSM